MAGMVLSSAMSSLRIAAKAPKPFTAAKSLSSKANGIAAAPKLSVALRAQQQVAPAALEIVAADGPRGCKLKTRKAAAKRYKVTGSGKVMVRRSGKQHLNEKMSKAKKKCLGKKVQVSESDMRKIKGCLPYAGLQ